MEISHQLPELSVVSQPLYKIFRTNMNKRIQRLLGEALAEKHSSGTGESSITSASRTFLETHDADDFFNKLRPELFRVREWNEKATLTSFELFDEKGDISERENAVVGDFIRLSMAGTGKNDWVKVIEIIDEAGEAILTIKPSYDPSEKEPDKNTTSHFFTSDATNSFCLEKSNAIVSFYVIGLCEKTNTGETGSFVEKARNVAVSKVGLISGYKRLSGKLFALTLCDSRSKNKWWSVQTILFVSAVTFHGGALQNGFSVS